MKFKKIIKFIIGIGAVGGAAYAAYKLGVSDGETAERKHRLREVEDDDIDDYFFDEPDDECIAPNGSGEK
ncbi:MAG: hypothetical protein IJ555_10275 [Ruminococcus sp.]|uniref:hypothetical protein n=1 Tax=Ruminococcus sp. TaxID=41978 RepID=UPI0025FBB98C|nr:hypothetical protein [Ruminococcus sp.]MBR1384172.1 hypothetical protein [Ruminococcus sp.]MBR1431803.1 hypothetical protein [Ruminococcus sp.]